MEILQCTLGIAMSNCYLLYDGTPGEDGKKPGVFIDPGDSADVLLAECEKRGIAVKAVLLTHGHFDHMMAAPRIREVTGAKILAPAGDAEILADADANLSDTWQHEPTTLKADVWLEDNEEITILGEKMQVMVTPGHTPGGCCFYFPNLGWVFTGDTLMRGSYGRLDLPQAVPESIGPSIKRILTLPKETQVFPGHEGMTTIEYERRHNPMRKG